MLTIRDPFADFPSLFPVSLRGTSNGTSTKWSPPLDIVEDDQGLSLMVEVPGMSMEDLQVEVGSNVVTISGEKKKCDQGRYKSERSYGRFARSVRLPSNADVDTINATLKNGILTVSMDKTGSTVAWGRHWTKGSSKIETSNGGMLYTQIPSAPGTLVPVQTRPNGPFYVGNTGVIQIEAVEGGTSRDSFRYNAKDGHVSCFVAGKFLCWEQFLSKQRIREI